MSKRPTGFKTQEDYNAYMRSYKAKRRAEKKIRDDPYLKATLELQTNFNKWLMRVNNSENINEVVESELTDKMTLIKKLENEMNEKVKQYNSEIPKTMAPESIVLLHVVNNLRGEINFVQIQIQVLYGYSKIIEKMKLEGLRKECQQNRVN